MADELGLVVGDANGECCCRANFGSTGESKWLRYPDWNLPDVGECAHPVLHACRAGVQNCDRVAFLGVQMHTLGAFLRTFFANSHAFCADVHTGREITAKARGTPGLP